MSPRSSPPIDEKSLRFAFGDGWTAVKWDVHRAYREGLENQDGTKAVDIVAASSAFGFWLIEVKDPRGHRISNKNKRKQDPVMLDEAIAQKVRDTIAGLTWAVKRFNDSSIATLAKLLFAERSEKVQVVLWLEDVQPAAAIAYKEAISRHLRWLNPKVHVTSRALGCPMREVEVTSLAGAAP